MIRLVAPRRARPENIVPMINVAFLLLIFFLMTAVIAPSDPVAVTPPSGIGERLTQEERQILIEADGTLWLDGRPGTIGADFQGQNVSVRADKALDGRRLAAVLQQLHLAGAGDVILTVAAP